MNLGDIWGATETPAKKPRPQRYHFDSTRPDDVKEAMLLIHHKIIAMHDQYDTEETELDNDAIRRTTDLYHGAWQAVLDLNISFYRDKTFGSSVVCVVAERLLKVTNEEWMEIIAKRESIPELEDLEDNHEPE